MTSYQNALTYVQDQMQQGKINAAEVYYHKNSRHIALDVQQKCLKESTEILKKAYA